MTKLVILSGGLDSTILTYDVFDKHDDVHAITFDYNQKQSLEIDCAKATCFFLNIPHKILDISFMGDLLKGVSANIQGSEHETPTIKDVLGEPQPITYVPFRNMMLLSIGLAYAEAISADEVFTGLQVHDEYGYWDTTEEFVKRINNITTLNRLHKIVVQAPYGRLTKTDEIKIGIELDVDFYHTLTCYNPVLSEPGGVIMSCGRCPSCSERIVAFAKNGIADPVEYAINLDWKKLIEKYAEPAEI